MDQSAVLSWFKTLPKDGQKDLCRQLFKASSAGLLSELQVMLTEMQKRDFIVELPKELSKKILTYLDNSDLVNVQLVCKKLNRAIIDLLPLYRVICKYLDVDKSEYETEKQAMAICNHIVEKRQTPFSDWFTFYKYDLWWDDLKISGIKFSKVDDATFMVTYGMNDYGQVVAIDIVDICDIINCSAANRCRFQTSHPISKIKFCNPESLFVGTSAGTIERWNRKSELVTTYQQHSDYVASIRPIEEQDLLFSGDCVGGLYSWRMSTGELLCQCQVQVSDAHGVESIKCNTIFSPITVAVRMIKRFVVFSCLDDGRRLDRIYDFETEGLMLCSQVINVGLRYLYTNISGSIVMDYHLQTKQTRRYDTMLVSNFKIPKITKDGFRFVNKTKSKLTIDDYTLNTGEIRRHQLELGSSFQRIIISAMGSKYCLLSVWFWQNYKLLDSLKKRANLILFERKVGGEVWKLRGELTPNDLAGGDTEYVFPNREADWLNGLRPGNTNGLAFAFISRDRKEIYCGFWK